MEEYTFFRTPVDTMDEYIEICKSGRNPLIEWKAYNVNFDLRIELQNLLFGKSELGKGNILKSNQLYYKYCWENKLHVCDECMKPLHEYSSVYISHILTRGGHADMAHDPRNSRILCGECHPLVEEEETHSLLKIYQLDLIIIEILKDEYNGKNSEQRDTFSFGIN